MLQRIAPITVCSVIIFFTLKSMITGQSVVEAKPLNIDAPNSLVSYQYNKIDGLSACENEGIAVYFHDAYMSYHSAEVINDALATAKSCNISTINVTAYDIPNEDTPAETVQSELKAYIKHHNLEAYAQYDIKKIDTDTLALNGRVAKISFGFDDSEEMKTASYNGPIN